MRGLEDFSLERFDRRLAEARGYRRRPGPSPALDSCLFVSVSSLSEPMGRDFFLNAIDKPRRLLVQRDGE